MLTLYTPRYIPIVDERLVILSDEEGNELVKGEGGQYIALEVDDYYVKEKVSGLDELRFELSITDPAYIAIQELSSIVDSDKQRYLVRKIDGGSKTADIIAELDLDDWKADMRLGYTNGSKTAQATLEEVAPEGWGIVNNSGITSRRTITGNMTPFDVLQSCIDTYGVYIRINNNDKIVTLYSQVPGIPSGAFATRQLNLTEINYKGTAEHEDFCTRLYCFGKDGMTFADINGGMPYIDDFTYSERVVCGIWEDDRYTNKESLLEDARRKLHSMAVPARSYECDVVDLKAVDPEKYSILDFSLFTTATLIDDIRGTSINYQVVERWRYPHYPERNKVVFSDVPVSVQNQVVQIREAINNPNSSFRQGQAALVESATNWLTSANGYLVLVQNEDKSFKELLAMDTNDVSTAKNVLRLNNNGIGFSTTGVNGPYTNAWTIDGRLIADFISSGTIEGKIVAKDLTMEGGSINLTTNSGDYDAIQLNFGNSSTLISTYTVNVENRGLGVSTLHQSRGLFVYDINDASQTDDDVQRAFYGRGIQIRDADGALVFYVLENGATNISNTLVVGKDAWIDGRLYLEKQAHLNGGLYIERGDEATILSVACPAYFSGGLNVNGYTGIDGTYTIGSSRVTIHGGIITNIS